MDSNPYELKAYDKAYLLKRKQQDEIDWILGKYIMSAFATVLSKSFSKSSSAKYIEEPFLKSIKQGEEDNNSEKNEILAVAEFEKFISCMKEQGLPETGALKSLRGGK